jgi:hypothetical protein
VRARPAVRYQWMMLWRCGGPRPCVDLYDPWRQSFNTRAECVRYIREEYGYVRDHRDFRRAPHYWRMPVPVRVKVTASIVG